MNSPEVGGGGGGILFLFALTLLRYHRAGVFPRLRHGGLSLERWLQTEAISSCRCFGIIDARTVAAGCFQVAFRDIPCPLSEVLKRNTSSAHLRCLKSAGEAAEITTRHRVNERYSE